MFDDNSKVVIDFILILTVILLFLIVITSILIKYPFILFFTLTLYSCYIADRILKNKD